jgi:hypothetical protein
MLIRPSGRFFEGISQSRIENQPSLNWEAPPFLQLRTRIFRPLQDVWGQLIGVSISELCLGPGACLREDRDKPAPYRPGVLTATVLTVLS